MSFSLNHDFCYCVSLGMFARVQEICKVILRPAHTRGLVPATTLQCFSLEELTQMDWLKGLVPSSVYTVGPWPIAK